MLVVLAVLACQMPGYAQNKITRTPNTTSKDKSKKGYHSDSKGTLSVESFLRKRSGDKGFTDFKRNSEVIKALKNAGFIQKSKKKTREYIGTDDEDGEIMDECYANITEFVYSKKGVKVEWTLYTSDGERDDEGAIGVVIITFDDRTSLNSFMSNLRAAGFYKTEYGLILDAQEFIFIDVKGNSVTFYTQHA